MVCVLQIASDVTYPGNLATEKIKYYIFTCQIIAEVTNWNIYQRIREFSFQHGSVICMYYGFMRFRPIKLR